MKLIQIPTILCLLLALLETTKADDKFEVREVPSAVSSIEGDGRFPPMETFYGNHGSENSKLLPNVQWSDVVLMIFMYNDEKIDKLIEGHFETWLRRVGEGADIVFITDSDDVRSDNSILPLAKSITATSHVYRSSAANEGKHLRYKVIDAFRYVGETFKDKKFFLKLDTGNVF